MRSAWDNNEMLLNWLVGGFVYLIFLAVFSSQIHILHLYMLRLFAEGETESLGEYQD